MIAMSKSVACALFALAGLTGGTITSSAAWAADAATPCGPAPTLSLKRLDARPASINGDAFVAQVNSYAAKAKARSACLAKVAVTNGTTSPAMAPAPSGD
ncbi:MULTISPECIES: hypothetical protein [Nitrospirillum]|uniref:UrcA family protein n=1 Tax=Nitrospirillum amazonense TaxID=28077 RepID=A0A560FMV9_9PROT|nr:hypothetical protein [Nitrospirillum amazonense]MEC4591573.1 hypothetical protein [Nitrospirillum amazonense]TWB22959.1 hypothetical protein FBZ88_115107 [Nitrospirillum amazonense]